MSSALSCTIRVMSFDLLPTSSWLTGTPQPFRRLKACILVLTVSGSGLHHDFFTPALLSGEVIHVPNHAQNCTEISATASCPAALVPEMSCLQSDFLDLLAISLLSVQTSFCLGGVPTSSFPLFWGLCESHPSSCQLSLSLWSVPD